MTQAGLQLLPVTAPMSQLYLSSQVWLVPNPADGVRATRLGAWACSLLGTRRWRALAVWKAAASWRWVESRGIGPATSQQELLPQEGDHLAQDHDVELEQLCEVAGPWRLRGEFPRSAGRQPVQEFRRERELRERQPHTRLPRQVVDLLRLNAAHHLQDAAEVVQRAPTAPHQWQCSGAPSCC